MKQINWTYLLIEVTLLVGGLFLAMQLDQWATANKISQRKDKALKNIRAELERNKDELETSGNNEDFYTVLQGVYPFIDMEEGAKELRLKATLDEMNTLRDSFPENLVVSDSIKITGTQYHYTTGINVGGFNYVQLGDIAWEAAKFGNLIDQIEFECIEELLEVYKMQETYLQYQEKYIEVLIEDDVSKILNQFSVLYEFWKALGDTYEETLDNFEICME